MSQIKDHVLRAFYKKATLRVHIFSIIILLLGIGIGYLIGPLYPNLVAAAMIIFQYVLLFFFKRRLASGTYPANNDERADFERFLAQNGGRVMPGISLD